MEKKEYWICPECGSEVDMDKNGCWRCRFVTDDVSKYKYDRIAGFISNLKIMLFVFTSLAALSVAVIFFIVAADNYYVARQNRIAMELKAQKEQQLRDYEARMEEMQRERDERDRQSSNERYQRYQAQRDNAQQKISNLENQYNNCLAQYGNANGAYEQIHIQKEMERILEGINNIAAKENIPYKIIKNVQSKVRMDIAKRYGH